MNFILACKASARFLEEGVFNNWPVNVSSNSDNGEYCALPFSLGSAAINVTRIGREMYPLTYLNMISYKIQQ